jgi:carboxyl-terminal processing protease
MFTEKSLSEFKSIWKNTVNEINEQDPKAIVLDLRNNTGGFVDAGVYVFEEFFGEDVKVMSEVGRQGVEREIYTSREGVFKDIPLVVLVNQGTASASEIVAGAIQDHARAKLVGNKTFGKGVEQNKIPLDDGSQLLLVFKRWLTPKGRYIDFENPLAPDVEVDYTSEDYENDRDPQLDEALKILGN